MNKFNIKQVRENLKHNILPRRNLYKIEVGVIGSIPTDYDIELIDQVFNYYTLKIEYTHPSPLSGEKLVRIEFCRDEVVSEIRALEMIQRAIDSGYTIEMDICTYLPDGKEHQYMGFGAIKSIELEPLMMSWAANDQIDTITARFRF